MVKLSRIYFDALSMIAHPSQELPRSLSLLRENKAKGPGGIVRLRYYREIVRMAAPPSGGGKAFRLLHPDAVVLGFAAISGFVLLEMSKSRSPGLIPAVAALAVALAAYLIWRRFVMRSYRRAKETEAAEKRRVRGAVEEWIRLYYCGKDGTVFDPASARSYALTDLAKTLLGEQP